MDEVAMTDSITRFYGCYKSKTSAARAMRNWVGNQIEVSWEGVSNRFETTVMLREDMMSVTQLQGGWGVSIRYTKNDLLCVIMGADGFPKDVAYAEVAHWIDATHPTVKTPRGVFRIKFDSIEAAKEAGFHAWFTHTDGTVIVGDGSYAYAVRNAA